MQYPSDQKVRVARQRYYEQNGLSRDGGASGKIGRADFGPVRIYVPNFPARVAALQRHDLHHIILDADTSMKGEAIVGGFETGAGCGRFWVAWFLEPQALAYGLILSPTQTFQSFLLGRRSQSLFHGPFRQDWLDMTVGELRNLLLAKGEHAPNAADVISFSLWTMIGVLGLAVSIGLLSLPFVGVYFLIVGNAFP